MTCSRVPAALVGAAFAFALALGGPTGCGSEGPAGRGDTHSAEAGGALSVDGPSVVLGSGRAAFEPVAADGTVPLIRGIQGGFHVWTSFLAYGFDTDVVRMELTTSWDEVGDSSIEMKGNVALRPATDPAGVPALLSLGWPASIFNPTCANGRHLALAITVIDMAANISASGESRWVVDVAEDDRANDCAP